MMSYWTGFAYNGMPGTGMTRNQPEWKRAGSENRFMVFDTVADSGVRMMNISLDAKTVLDNIATDPALEENGWRCVVYRYMEEKERFVTKGDLARLGCLEDLVP